LGIQKPSASLDKNPRPKRILPDYAAANGGALADGRRLPGFKAVMLAFERANWALGIKVLSCFALKLGVKPDFFTDCHDPLSAEYRARCGFSTICRW
jgi:isopenicillin N synthase-like dioxygenase